MNTDPYFPGQVAPGEGGGAIGGREFFDKISGPVAELGGDPHRVDDFRKAAVGVVEQPGLAPKRVGDFADLFCVGGDTVSGLGSVGEGGDFSERIGDGGEPKLGVISELEGVAPAVDELSFFISNRLNFQ